MCNLYSVTTNIQAIRDLVKGFRVNEAAKRYDKDQPRTEISISPVVPEAG